jgi:ABC-type multidrug transport system fused ATPase/permease subunit
MIRAIEVLDRPEMVRAFRSLISMQFITMFLSNISDRFSRHGADALSRSLKGVVGKAIISQDMRYFDVVSSPASVLSDAERIDGDLVYRPQRVLGRIVNLASTAAVAYKQSPELLYRMALCMPATQLVRAIIIHIFHKRSARARRGRMDMGQSPEGLANVCIDSETMKLVRSFGREIRTLEEYDTTNKVQDLLAQQTDMLLDVLRPLFNLAQRSGTYLGLWTGSLLVLQGKMSAADVAVAVNLSERLVQGVQSMFQKDIPALAKVLQPASRVTEMLRRTPTMGIDASIGHTPQERLRGEIEFRDVHFAYPRDKNKKVLRGLSFRLGAGQSLGIVGAAGCGKSTALALLLRLYDPQHGCIFIDGRDICDFNPPWLRKQMAVVQQTPFIVDGDIRFNLCFGQDEDPSQEEIEAACKRTNAYKLIMEQPEKWRTSCEDLSPGQKQIITITRALLRNPQILILDECTASLDADTQELVANAIETLMQGRTTVQIAHRLVVVQHSDRIVCLEDGAVAESGTHKELMANADGMYRRMVLKQNLDTSSDASDGSGGSDGSCEKETAGQPTTEEPTPPENSQVSVATKATKRPSMPPPLPQDHGVLPLQHRPQSEGSNGGHWTRDRETIESASLMATNSVGGSSISSSSSSSSSRLRELLLEAPEQLLSELEGLRGHLATTLQLRQQASLHGFSDDASSSSSTVLPAALEDSLQRLEALSHQLQRSVQQQQQQHQHALLLGGASEAEPTPTTVVSPRAAAAAFYAAAAAPHADASASSLEKSLSRQISRTTSSAEAGILNEVVQRVCSDDAGGGGGG